MSTLKVLLAGGTGIISSAVAKRAVALGYDVTVLHRGVSTLRPLPDGVTSLIADVRDRASVQAVLGDSRFDVVVDFLSFVPEHVAGWVEELHGRTGQYVFVSSASAYQTPPSSLPITESTPLRNPMWEYSRNKIACEDLLIAAYRERGFPVTIVRPSHTYDRSSLPFKGGWTVLDRMLRGEPVVVHGDGSSLWTITHADDVAVGIVGLLGRSVAVGEAYTVTGAEAPTWDRIHATFAAALGVSADLVHVPSDVIAREMPGWGPGLLGDKSHSMVFDTSKIRALVPDFEQRIPLEFGVADVVQWHLAHPEAQVVEAAAEAAFDRMIMRFA